MLNLGTSPLFHTCTHILLNTLIPPTVQLRHITPISHAHAHITKHLHPPSHVNLGTSHLSHTHAHITTKHPHHPPLQFNLDIPEVPDVIVETKRSLTFPFPVGRAVCVEISLTTTDGDTLTLERWKLSKCGEVKVSTCHLLTKCVSLSISIY